MKAEKTQKKPISPFSIFTGAIVILTTVLAMCGFQRLAFWALIIGVVGFYFSYVVRSVIKHKKELKELQNKNARKPKPRRKK